MIDLYRRISLSTSTDSQSTIADAIRQLERSQPEVARRARHILLNPERKRVYDRTHAVLNDIGQLRANLGLTHAQNWQDSNCSDFNKRPSSRRSELEFIGLQPNTTAASSSSEAQSGCAGWLWLVVAIPLIFIAGKMILNDATDTSPRSARPQSPQRHSESPRVTRPQVNRPSAEELHRRRVQEFVTTRLEKSGIALDSEVFDVAVQMLISGEGFDRPQSGVVNKSFVGAGVAPLEIKTRFGKDYYIKVIDWTTRSEVLTAYVRGGIPFETKLPVGSYELRYAAGSTWFGPYLDFGDEATYARCEDRFDFTKTFNGYNGYTVELILQTGGNLETEPMRAEDF